MRVRVHEHVANNRGNAYRIIQPLPCSQFIQRLAWRTVHCSLVIFFYHFSKSVEGAEEFDLTYCNKLHFRFNEE